jgi:hypothetical protein
MDQDYIAHRLAEMTEEVVKSGKLGPNPTVYKIAKLAALSGLKFDPEEQEYDG